MLSDQYFTERFPCQLSQIFVDGKLVIFSFARDFSDVWPLMLFPGLLLKPAHFLNGFEAE